MKIFFVSNSTCYYFTDELMGLLMAAGHSDVTLALAYASGCSLEKHLRWMKEAHPGYQFRVWDQAGLHVYKDYTLEQAMAYADWDVISFDNNARSFASGDVATSLAQAEPHFGELYSAIQEKFPKAAYYWHEVWANEIGYSLAFKMETPEQRSAVYGAKRGVMEHMVKHYGLGGVPTGDAWERVRDLDLFTRPIEPFGDVDRFSLCSRIGPNGFKDDYTHDGDIGGGQYLNACVWFEILTGECCLTNPYRPVYTYDGVDCSLSEEKISVLKQAAHDVVSLWKKHQKNAYSPAF